MSNKEIGLRKEKDLIKQGVNRAANLIKVTIGAEGRTVIISDTEGVRATKDGVTVASYIKFRNPYENIGAKMVIEGAEQTAELAGDGTTTTAILIQAIINKCDSLLHQSHVYSFLNGTKQLTGNKLINQLKDELKIVLEELKSQSIPINIDSKENLKKLFDIINVSSNGDTEIVNLISDIINKIGKDSTINFEESLNNETYSKVFEGMSFEKGYISDKFITDRSSSSCTLDNPYVLVIDKIESFKNDLFDILTYVMQQKRSILIICNEINEDALTQVLNNINRGNIKGCVVKTPHFGLRREETIIDIVELVGTKYICKSKGLTIDDFEYNHLGEIESCSIYRDYTILKANTNSNERLQNRIAELKQQITDTKYSFDIERLQDRLSRLQGGIATIYVGGTTEIEMKEKKDRVEDAIKAVKSALEEGVVIGGGMALYNISTKLPKSSILKSCLIEPLKQILINGGENFNSHLKWLGKYNHNYGYNIRTKELEPFLETGILDSHKVLRVALEHAVSIAISFISSEGFIVEYKEKNPNETNIVMPNFLGNNK